MCITLQLQADGTTTNFSRGSIYVEAVAENTGVEPVTLHPGWISVELRDAEGRLMPVSLLGRALYKERTVDPGGRMQFVLDLDAPDIRLGRPFELKAWWQDIRGEGATPILFRPIRASL